MDYKNEQLTEKIMFESFFRYHTKKEGYPNICSDINKLGEIASGGLLESFKIW
jgi:hypothetical protein